MSNPFLIFLMPFLIWSSLKALANDQKNISCEGNHEFGSIGAVIDLSSRVGKEQKIAMKMALDDFVHSSPCSKLHLHFQDSRGNSARAASQVIELLNFKKAQAILGALTLQEAALVWEYDEVFKHIPIISLMPTTTSTSILPHQPQSFIPMTYDIDVQMQGIAAIVGHFGWQKVIAIYERSNSFSGDSALLTHLSDSLQPAGSVLAHHFSFPRLDSLSEPEQYIEGELKKLRSKAITVFTVLQCSLDFAIALFKKAKELGMMDKGYVWIISDDIASLLDYVESSIMKNYMQGVVGLKANFIDTSDSFRSFEGRFSREYRTEYPEEDKHFSPSVHALQAYDATMATARAMQNAEEKAESNQLIKYIMANKFQGLSGNIHFNNGSLVQEPIFQIFNIIGKGYHVIGMWTPKFGFLEETVEYMAMKMKVGNDVQLGSVYWPGGEPNVPKGLTLSSINKPLRIAVPANAAFKQFVNVTYDSYRKQNIITGFSIEVFEAAVKQLSYHLPYGLIPFYGSYDEMVAQVHIKTFDAAIGDIEIKADRFKIASFTHPYMDAGLVMVVTVKPDLRKTWTIVLEAFTLKMWIVLVATSLLTGVVIWLNEYVDENTEFNLPFPQLIWAMLWFSVVILDFSQRERIKHNLSRLLLSTWLFVTVIVAACFTASVTSIITVPKLEPSADMDQLLRSNAAVGCNGNSFIVKYLTDVLHFRPENIMPIHSFHDYHNAFKSRYIKAAFFVVPHAKIFLAEYCNSYTMTEPTHKLGGFGFVFSKESPLAADFSEAILQITESGTIKQLETHLPSPLDCSSSDGPSGDDGNQGLGIEPFIILFLVHGGLLAITFLYLMGRLVIRHREFLRSINASMISRGTYTWVSGLLVRLYRKSGTTFFRRPKIEAPTDLVNDNGNDLAPNLRVQELAAYNVPQLTDFLQMGHLRAVGIPYRIPMAEA